MTTERRIVQLILRWKALGYSESWHVIRELRRLVQP